MRRNIRLGRAHPVTYTAHDTRKKQESRIYKERQDDWLPEEGQPWEIASDGKIDGKLNESLEPETRNLSLFRHLRLYVLDKRGFS